MSQVSAQQITAMITLAHPTFSATNWQTFLLSLAITIVVFAANTLIFRKLPLIETVLAVVHVVGFVAIIAVLWYESSIYESEFRERSTDCMTVGQRDPGTASLTSSPTSKGRTDGRPQALLSLLD